MNRRLFSRALMIWAMALMLWHPTNAGFAETAPVGRLEDAVVYTVNEAVRTPDAPELTGRLDADVLIRACFKWRNSPHLDPRLPERARRAGALFGGGITCSVVFEDENGLTLPQVEEMSTRGIDGEMLAWPPGPRQSPYGHHGSLSSPAYLEYLLRWCREQIDAGVDGLFMDECGNALLPAEGYDDASLADFARYLSTEDADTKEWSPDDARWQTRFNVDLHDPKIAPTGKIDSFNYRVYLQTAGLAKSDDPRNPLAAAWKKFGVWRDRRAWKTLTDRIHAYAQTKGRQVFISGNGLYPFVDLQVSNNWKEDEQMERDGHIDLTQSRVSLWRSMVKQGQAIAEQPVPVVIFHDWGATFPWLGVPAEERRTWMRTRGAEIYAAGGFFAFPVRGPHGCDTEKDGTLGTIAEEAAFYRAHRKFFLRSRFLGTSTVRTDSPDLSLAVCAAEDPQVLLVHAINRQCTGAKLVPRREVDLRLTLTQAPDRAVAYSPDWTEERAVGCRLQDSQLYLSLAELDAHAVIALHFENVIDPAILSGLCDKN